MILEDLTEGIRWQPQSAVDKIQSSCNTRWESYLTLTKRRGGGAEKRSRGFPLPVSFSSLGKMRVETEEGNQNGGPCVTPNKDLEAHSEARRGAATRGWLNGMVNTGFVSRENVYNLHLFFYKPTCHSC